MKFLLFLFSYSLLAQEGGLKIPMSFETSKVLPKKVRNIRIRNSYFQANEKFSNSKKSVALGNALNKNVTYLKTINGKRDDFESSSLRAAAKKSNIDVHTSMGQVTGNVEANVDVFLPVIAYGVTKYWTVAMAIPIVKTTTAVDTGYIANEGISKFAKENLSDKGLKRKAYELQDKTNNAVSNKLSEYEYTRLEGEENTDIGDIHLINKFLLGKRDKFSWSLRQAFTLPTGKPSDINKIVSLPTGDGQWDISSGLIVDYFATSNFTVNVYSGINFQLPHKDTRRIPIEQDSKITYEKERVDIDLGDQFISQISAKYSMPIGFSFLAGYTFQYKDRDRFKGEKFTKNRYKWLAQESEQHMQTLQAGIGYSTLALFKSKKFPVPLEANLFYSNVFKGKNVLNENMLTLEAAVFF